MSHHRPLADGVPRDELVDALAALCSEASRLHEHFCGDDTDTCGHDTPMLTAAFDLLLDRRDVAAAVVPDGEAHQ